MTRSTPLHILHLTAPAAVGGLETVVLALVHGLRGRGHRVTVLAATEGDRGHPFIGALRERTADVVIPPAGYRAEIGFLRDFATAERVDIVHSHGYRPDVIARLAGFPSRYRTASTVHGFTGGGLKNRFYERIQRAALRRFDAVIAVSRPLQDLLLRSGIRKERLHLIPNAGRSLDPLIPRAQARGRLGLPPDGVVIGWVGRLSREKAPDVALEALSRLPRGDWTAAFLGDGPDQARLVALASRLGLSSRIRWLGTVPRASPLFQAFDVLLQSSRTEGTPVVLLEAMAAGVPIVATAVGGVPDLVGGGDAGWLAPADNPSALSRALEEALAGGPVPERKIAAARRRLGTEYDPEAWLTRYETVYRELMAPPGPPAR